MLGDQDFAERNHVFGLGVEEPDGLDVILQAEQTKLHHSFGCFYFFE